MDRKLPTLRQLQYFEALERHGHFGRAAAACNVSQSAFSNAIAQLEQLLAARLVDRDNKNVTITHLGQQVATHARLCLRDVEGLVELAAAGTAPFTGTLRLGVIPTIAPFLLPATLPRLRNLYPELRIYIRELTTDRIHADLLNGELDMGLVALPWPLRNMTVKALFTDPFLLACREDTTLIDPQNFAPHRIPAQSLLLLEDGHCLRDHVLEACRLKNTGGISRFSASSLYTLIEMVNSDLGITFLPQMAVDSELVKNTRIRTWPLPARNRREIGAIWRASSGRAEEFGEIAARFAP